jgi:tetratricopeptide (TPR) repeat protein
MKIFFAIALSVFFFGAASLPAQHAMPAMGKIAAKKLDGYGQLHFTVTSTSEEAKAWVNQGLRLCYAFNHPEAIANFEKAISLDPSCAMCYWGLAFAQGNNINQPLMPEYAKPAYENSQKALALARQGKATARETALIEALAQRYAPENPADRSALDKAYAMAMRQVAAKYPDDLDAQTLAADSLMNLTPWKLWDRAGKPNTYTEEIIAKLETVLQRNPDHIGANHLYIHAVEASPTPERALRSADILGNLASASGHLVHMPAHIYMRTGDYESAARVNRAAAELDRQYFASIGGPSYYTPYWIHNLHFLSAARAMQGVYQEASDAIWEASKRLEPVARMNQGFEAFLAMPYFLEVRFQKWDKILAHPAPASFSVSVENSWRFARAMAFAAKGDLANARAEQAKFVDAVAKLSPDRGWSLNTEKQVMQIAIEALAAKIAHASGNKQLAAEHLAKAVALEDSLAYDEPAGWYYPPMREGLGAVLIDLGRADEAEKVYREELLNNRRNPRALFGLYASLFAQGRMEEAEMVRPLFESAWAKAGYQLTLKQLF